MADREETPGSGSPLSDIDSDEFTEDMKFNRSRSHSNASTISDAASDASATPSASTPRHSDMPPAKRRRIGASSYDHPTPLSTMNPPRSPSGSISSDSSGSVPTSPSFAHLGPTHPLSTAYAAAQANPDNPEMADYVQVTRCQWTGCTDPEQGNMDKLVSHINDIHILPRQKKYFCEWEGCNRKSMPHTSAYALKAHMRSHTKEKPFLCALPECDRSFTRSDALAKHMRTVHETEALRPSDPVPRGHTGGISTGGQPSNGTVKRIKLVMNNGDKKGTPIASISELPPLPTKSFLLGTQSSINPDSAGATLTTAEAADADLVDAVDIDAIPLALPVSNDYYPTDIYSGMDEYERNLPPSQYFRLLRRQLKWAKQEEDQLAKDLVEARCATDDLQGNVVHKTTSATPAIREAHGISHDERIGDDNRREEWQVVEGLLDRLLKAELVSTINEGDSRRGVNGKIKSDPNFDKEGPDSINPSHESAIDAILDEANPWTLLQSSRRRQDHLV